MSFCFKIIFSALETILYFSDLSGRPFLKGQLFLEAFLGRQASSSMPMAPSKLYSFCLILELLQRKYNLVDIINNLDLVSV